MLSDHLGADVCVVSARGATIADAFLAGHPHDQISESRLERGSAGALPRTELHQTKKVGARRIPSDRRLRQVILHAV